MSDEKRVLVADPMTAEFQKRWMEDLDGLPVKLVLLEDPSPEAFRDAVSDAAILITRNREIDAEVLEQAGPSLRMVIKLSRWSVGIDMDACSKRGIQVIHVPQLGCITVAEHAMTLLLMCARDMIRSHLGVISGAYRDHGLTPKATSERSFAFKWIPVNPLEAYGKSLGIVGFGEIGKELAARAKAFGMQVLYFDQQEAPEEIEAELGAQYEELDALLASSDFISLHIPHTPATDKLIDADRFRLMKPTAFLLNACRGGVIDEEAMVDALKTGRIAGAGLDVFIEEPLPLDHPLTQLENVVLTPHIGGGSGTGRADQKRRLQELISKAASWA
jgi:D-3-phosphoglycerate dehydrogenase / 2-oxoglutarate reductase